MHRLVSLPRAARWRGLLTVALGMTVAGIGRTAVVPPLGARLAVCFPPGVPVFGDALPEGPPPRQARHFAWYPPDPLADYVNEAFYPALSTRLMARSLGGKLEQRLDAYRLQRNQLVNELADQLLALQMVDAATRESELRAFAEQQNPRIVALEREAEELRRALIEGSLLQLSVDWSRARQWRIGATRFENDQAEKEAQFQVVRAAAYYADGLGVEQRGLLLELASELQVRARAAGPGPQNPDNNPEAMYFSPATARLRLPKNATPRLVTLLARFNRGKTDLKEELRQAVLANDRAPREERAADFAALTERQWPQLVDLEKLADDIRQEMSGIPPAPLRAGPKIPARLIERVDAHNRELERYIADFEQTLRAEMELHRLNVRTRPTLQKQARKLAEERVALRAKVAQQFRTETRERLEAMRQRYALIKEQLKLVAAGQFDSETGEPLTVESLILGYNAAEERFDAFGREEVIYRGYRLAMLMPGLSPEQRRLLFGAALVGLAQPLPRGEPMPTGSQPVPRSG